MDANKARRLCDQLRECIDAGPGHNPLALSEAMGVVKKLLAATPWDLPYAVLVSIETQIPLWFSDKKWRGDEAQLRSNILQDIATAEKHWDRPAGRG